MKILISLLLILFSCESCENTFAIDSTPHDESIVLPAVNDLVIDNASYLTKSENNKLKVQIQSVAHQGGPKIYILTVNSLQNNTIEKFALEYVKKIQSNNSQNDNSTNHVIILVAKKERQTRIELGNAVKSKISELESLKIINQFMIPEFKNGRFYAGLKNAIWAIASKFSISPAIGSEFKNLIKHRAKFRGIEESQFNIAFALSLVLVGLISFFVRNSLLKPALCASSAAVVFHIMLQTTFLTSLAATFGILIGTVQILNRGISKLEYIRSNVGFNGRKSSRRW